jgi:hypothetical protein
MDDHFNLIVAGSRTFDDFVLMIREVDKYIKELNPAKPVCIISGGAYGADKLGEDYAKLRFYDMRLFKPNWLKFSKAAGAIRNGEMVAISEAAIYFYDGSSRGTQDCINKAKAKGIPYTVINFVPKPISKPKMYKGILRQSLQYNEEPDENN